MPFDVDDLPLAREFPAATRADWLKLVDGVLKGAPFDRMVATTSDGLRIAPIYEGRRDAAIVAGRSPATPWQIIQRIDHPDAATANAQALTDLENGATGLSLVFAGAHAARGFGLEPTEDALDRALEGVHVDAGIDIELQFGPQAPHLPKMMLDLLSRRNIEPSRAVIRLGLDPIGASAVTGGNSVEWTRIGSDSFGAEVIRLASLGFSHCAVMDGRIIHDAGGSEAQELAYVLSVGVAYLRSLEQAGMGLDDARRMIFARLSADADQFMTLAKFRALRLLWANIEQNCGLTPRPLFVAADTAWRMLTQYDPYVNLLRDTVATFAAGLGGANSITVLPHTSALGLPDALARRIARNIQLILLEESNLSRVTDPAAGSGGIESLTEDLVQTAWSLFQEIEKAGGAFESLRNNLIQDHVSAVRNAREKNIARRRDVLTGASEFSNLHEVPVTVLNVAPNSLGTTANPTIKFGALAPVRLAQPFEHFRNRSDTILAAHGMRPKIFLATIGSHADFSARATFARSLFEAGGIEAIEGDGGMEPDGIAAAYKVSGAKLACLCSSDTVYASVGTETAKAIRAAGAIYIYLAGRPGENEAGLRAAGVDDFVFVGVDAIATVTAAYARIQQP